MALSEYDIERISQAIVDRLTKDDSFAKRISGMIAKESRMLTSRQAAERLGIARKTVCELAHQLGGIRGSGKSGHWTFPEDTLADLYIKYKQNQ